MPSKLILFIIGFVVHLSVRSRLGTLKCVFNDNVNINNYGHVSPPSRNCSLKKTVALAAASTERRARETLMSAGDLFGEFDSFILKIRNKENVQERPGAAVPAQMAEAHWTEAQPIRSHHELWRRHRGGASCHHPSPDNSCTSRPASVIWLDEMIDACCQSKGWILWLGSNKKIRLFRIPNGSFFLSHFWFL